MQTGAASLGSLALNRQEAVLTYSKEQLGSVPAGLKTEPQQFQGSAWTCLGKAPVSDIESAKQLQCSELSTSSFWAGLGQLLARMLAPPSGAVSPCHTERLPRQSSARRLWPKARVNHFCCGSFSTSCLLLTRCWLWCEGH